jgi:hypothetical protein
MDHALRMALILDDWMRDPIQLSATQDLLEVFDDRFGKSANMVISQVPVSDWHVRFPDPTLADAILDRSIHSAYRLTLLGDSQKTSRIPAHAARLIYNIPNKYFLSPGCAVCSGFGIRFHRQAHLTASCPTANPRDIRHTLSIAVFSWLKAPVMID